MQWSLLYCVCILDIHILWVPFKFDGRFGVRWVFWSVQNVGFECCSVAMSGDLCGPNVVHRQCGVEPLVPIARGGVMWCWSGGVHWSCQLGGLVAMRVQYRDLGWLREVQPKCVVVRQC